MAQKQVDRQSARVMVDGLQHAKEQAGRVAEGIQLWRLNGKHMDAQLFSNAGEIVGQSTTSGDVLRRLLQGEEKYGDGNRLTGNEAETALAGTLNNIRIVGQELAMNLFKAGAEERIIQEIRAAEETGDGSVAASRTKDLKALRELGQVGKMELRFRVPDVREGTVTLERDHRYDAVIVIEPLPGNPRTCTHRHNIRYSGDVDFTYSPEVPHTKRLDSRYGLAQGVDVAGGQAARAIGSPERLLSEIRNNIARHEATLSRARDVYQRLTSEK